jgi:hypothetical protein
MLQLRKSRNPPISQSTLDDSEERDSTSEQVKPGEPSLALEDLE